MPTNRTASAEWKRTREAFIRAERKKNPGGLTCWRCSRRIPEGVAYTNPMALQVDHVISPLDRPDLEHVFSNLRTAHRKCNRDRGRAKYDAATGNVIEKDDNGNVIEAPRPKGFYVSFQTEHGSTWNRVTQAWHSGVRYWDGERWHDGIADE